MTPVVWIECRVCQGEEGQLVNGKWVDCPCCQGEGGHPQGQNWSCGCQPKEETR